MLAQHPEHEKMRKNPRVSEVFSQVAAAQGLCLSASGRLWETSEVIFLKAREKSECGQGLQGGSQAVMGSIH